MRDVAPLSPFGRVLRRWRQARGMSQLALATSASTSTRHLSFLETGRAEPSREMVLRLAHALDVPLRERNALLGAAGFAPLYRESPLDAPGMSALQRMLDFTLSRFEPFPAFLVDRCYRVLRANQGAARALGAFAGDGAPWREQPWNLLHITLHPDGLRPYIVNFAEVAASLLARLERAVVALDDEELATDPCALPLTLDPVVPLHLKRGELELRLFSMLAQVGGAQDVTAAELHIESLMPADSASEALLRALS